MFRSKMKVLSAALAVGFLAAPVHAAFDVALGFDLLYTPSDGGSFFEIPAPGSPTVVLGSDHTNVGNPLCGPSSFDFGSGCVPTQLTDSIIQRKEVASVVGAGETATIDIELVALSLRSVTQVDVGSGLETIYARVLKDITNDVWIHGEDLGSTMSITFDDMFGGTFTSSLDFAFDFFGEVSGYIATIPVLFEQSGAGWSRMPPEGAVTIDGVNHLLSGPIFPRTSFPNRRYIVV